ncbi:hypothetical protein BDV12DRAFT_202214 [Aspergillus spectabilis]
MAFPIFEHQLLRLRFAGPHSDLVFLSLPDPASLEEILENPRVERVTDTTLRLHAHPPLLVHLLYDDPEGQGPAGGLLAAHRHDSDPDWLLVACDYPFFCVSALRQLTKETIGPVTCFENADGAYEPLLGIWTPLALRLLKENVDRGILGPKSVIVKSNTNQSDRKRMFGCST